jgi:predicted flavoprotein YhiN
MPARLAEQLLHECGIPADRRTSSLKREERNALIEAVTSYVLPWSGNEGYTLYLCGEMLDAFGPIGGHNFSWAWSTGRAAGMAAGTFS